MCVDDQDIYGAPGLQLAYVVVLGPFGDFFFGLSPDVEGPRLFPTTFKA